MKIIGTRKIIGTYKINKISLPCFDDKIFVQNNDDLNNYLKK